MHWATDYETPHTPLRTHRYFNPRLDAIKARLPVGDATHDEIANRLEVIGRRLSEARNEVLALKAELKKPLTGRRYAEIDRDSDAINAELELLGLELLELEELCQRQETKQSWYLPFL